MKNIFIRLNVAIVLLSAVSFRCLGAPDKYTPELNLKKGKIYKHRIVSEVNTTIDLQGQEMRVNPGSELYVQYEVMKQNEDVYDLRMTYQRIKMNMTSPTSVFIDSDSTETSSDTNVGDVFRSLVGIPIDIQLTKVGKIVSVKGADQLVEKLDALTEEQYKQVFGRQFSDKMIQTMLEQLWFYFPGKSVAVNDRWEVTFNLATEESEIISQMNLTLKQVNDNFATVECSGTLSTPEGGAVLQIQGIDAKTSVVGEQAGTILIDLKTGWIVRSELTQNSTWDIEVMGHSVQQKMETKTTVTSD